MTEIVVAGVFTLLSVATGIAAFAVVHMGADPTPKGEGEKLDIRRGVNTFAAAISDSVKHQTAKQWLLVLAAAIFIGSAAYRVQCMDLQFLAIGRLLLTALLLLAAMIFDWKTKRIPNAIIIIMLGLGTIFLALEYFFQPECFREQAISSIAGLLGFLVVFYLMARITKEGIGMGDVKLISVQGWMVGVIITLAGTLFSLLACSAAAVFLLFGKKKKTNDQIPFGPFIFFGYLVALLICKL